MQYLTIKQMTTKLNRSVNNIYDLVKQGHLPKPVVLGAQNIWREDIIDSHMAQLASEQGLNWSPAAPPALPPAP